MLSSFLITVILSACAASVLHWLLLDWRRLNWHSAADGAADDGWPLAFASAMQDIDQMPCSSRKNGITNADTVGLGLIENQALSDQATHDSSLHDGIDAMDNEPAHHIVPADVSDFVIPDFQVGRDSCEVALSFPNIDFRFWVGATGVTLVFDDGDEQLRLIFAGLKCPPLKDVSVAFDHPQSGRSLENLATLIGDSDIKTIQIPCPDEDEETAAEVQCGTGARNIPPPAEFHQFDPSREYVEIWLSGVECQADVLVRKSPDGRDALVVVDGHLSAILRGAPHATNKNVRLVPLRYEQSA